MINFRHRVTGLVLAVLMAGASAQALQTNVWNGSLSTVSNDWSTAENWSPATIPDANTVVASLTGDWTASPGPIIYVSNNITLAGLRADDTGGTSDKPITIGSNNVNSKITFDSPVATIYVNNGSNPGLTINPTVELAPNTTLNKTGLGTARTVINGDISGGANTTLKAGNMELFGNNSAFNGALIVDSNFNMRARGAGVTSSAAKFAGVLGNTATNMTVQDGSSLAIHSWGTTTSITNSKPIIFNSGNYINGALGYQATSNTVLAGAMTLQTNTLITYTTEAMAASNTLAGAIGDDGNNRSLSFAVTTAASTLFTNTNPNITGGDSELVLTGASTYGGDTYITSQTAPTNSFKTFYVRVQGNNRLPPTTKLYLGGTSSAFTLDVAGANGTLILDGNQTLAGLYTGTSAGTDSRVEGGKSSTSMLTLDIASGTTNVYDGFIGSDRANGNKIQLVKTGSGQLTLTTTNTYADGTIVSNGTLAVDGKIDGLVTVDAGATLMGSGTIGGAATVNGMLNPGNSPGTLNFDAALTLGSTSTSRFEIVSASSFDVLNNNSNAIITLDNGAKIIFDFTDNATVVKGDTFHVLQGWGSIQNNGAVFETVGLSNPALFGELDVNTGIVTVIPEPATIGMLGLGALVTLLIRRMRTA